MMPSTRRIFEHIIGALGNISDVLNSHKEAWKMQHEVNEALHERLLRLEKRQ